jgi:hypothetical protein
MFTRAVIANSVITSGFTAGPTSYFNLIPVSYFESLTNSRGEDFRTHANRATRELNSELGLESLRDTFMYNYATHTMGRQSLFSTDSGSGSPDTMAMDRTAQFVVWTDQLTNKKYLYQLFDKNSRMYKKVRTKGKQFRLNEAYLRDVNGQPTNVSLINGVEGRIGIMPPESNRSMELGLDIPRDTVAGYKAKAAKLRNAFSKAGIDISIREEALPKGIKGEVRGNILVLDPAQLTEDTTYHEFGHILLDMLPEDVLDRYIADIKRLRPDLAAVVARKYSDLTGRALGKEILTTAIGIEGARIERKNPSKLRMLINRVMRAIGRVFGVRPDPAVVLAEELFAGQIRQEGLTGVFNEAIQRSIDLQDRVRKVYTQVTSTLKRQKAKLENQKDTETQKQKLQEIEAQLNAMDVIMEKAKVKQQDINEFLDFQQFVLNKVEAIENSIQFLKETEHSALTKPEIYERLRRIDSLREDIDSLFSTNTENSTIAQMTNLIDNMEWDDTQSEEVKEVLQDLERSGRRLMDLREEYLDTVIPMMSKLLASYADPQLAANIQKMKDKVKASKDISGYRLRGVTNNPRLKKLRAEYKQSQKTTDPMTKEEYKAKALELKLQDLDNKIPGKKQLDAELRRAHVQKSGYAAAFDPIVYSSENNVQLFANLMRAELQEADGKTMDYILDLQKVYDPFKAHMGGDISPTKLNEKILTTKKVPLRDSNGKVYSYMEVLALVEPYDTAEWYGKRSKEFSRLAKETNRPKKGATRQEWRDWYRSFNATNYNAGLRNWYAENAQGIPNAESIWNGWNQRINDIDVELQRLEAENNPKDRDKKGLLYVEQNALKRRVRDSRDESNAGIVYMGELAMPNEDYRNDKYQEIMDTPELKNYYEYIKSKYWKAQERVGKSELFVNAWDDYSYVMPSLRREFVEGIRRGDTKSKETWKDLAKEAFINPFVKLDTDTEYGMMTDVDGDRVRYLPRYFTNLVPAAEVTTDVAQSMIAFEHMSHQFEAKAKMSGLVNGMLAAHEAKGAMATKGGLSVVDRLRSNKYVGNIIGEEKQNRELEHLQKWIDTVYYGELKEAGGAGLGEFDANKASSFIQRATAANSLMGNSLQIFNQLTLDNLMSLNESFVGEYWSAKDHAWAVATYFSEGAGLADTHAVSDKFLPESRLSKIMLATNAMVDVEEQLRNIKSNRLRKIVDTNTGYFGQRGIEHQVSGVRMLSLMKGITPLDKDGNQIEIDGKVAENMYDAFIENESGRMVLDPRVANIDIGRFTAKLHGISKRTNQVKGTFDASAMNRNWFFSMLMLFRNYLPGNVRKIFGYHEGYHVDHELGDVTRGMIPSALSVGANMWEEKGIKDGWANSSEVDQRNAKRVGMHALSYLAATMAFAAFDDEDDDEYVNVFFAYQARRLQTELLGLINPWDAARMIQRPLATSNTALNWLDLLKSMAETAMYKTFGVFEDDVLYQRRQGNYRKGDYKLHKKFTKVLPGLNGWQTAFWVEGSTENVQEKLKWFNQ